jgi:2-polyprenyl-3-methyl-5-hydroxy-6-metoxy-1,4-benzoquinol methylase
MACLCGGFDWLPECTFTEPPPEEPCYGATACGYRRTVYRCTVCGHYRNAHEMDTAALYRGDYNSSTYGDAGGMRARFERVNALPAEQSDNAGRVAHICAYFDQLDPKRKLARSVLDIGSGLGVFAYRMKQAGWQCACIDPDERSVAHAREHIGLQAFHGTFPGVQGLDRYGLITFNKVLEHVLDPAVMLAASREYLNEGGRVYIELPDGEAAAATEGFTREEFFVDHWHIFSMSSLSLLATRACFRVERIERLHEPSGKYTLRAFLVRSPRVGVHV